MRSILLYFIFLCGFSFTGFSQTRDAQLWENIFLSKKLSRNNELTFNHEGRISNNISQFYYMYGDFGFDHKLNKNLKGGLDYVLVWKKNMGVEHWRHQWYAFLTYKVSPVKQLDVGLRFMYQQQYQDLYTSETGRYPDNYLRTKMVIKYSPFYFPFNKFNPYIASELYYHMDKNTKYGRQFDRLRYFLGTYYKLNKKTAVELYYLIEDNFNINNPPVNYVIGIGFEREL